MNNNHATLIRNTPNILIVDDIPANLKVLGDILKEEGYKVRPVPSGALALQVAERERPDLILLDIMMPDMNGYEVCRLLKENKLLHDIPVIFISALSETNDVVKALKYGGVDYITKPFRAEEISARVKTHIKLRRQSIELQELNVTKDKFFSIIAHDLRGPMGGFMGLTDLLTEELSNMSMAEIQEFLGSMRESATNLFKLLENLLQWARVQQGGIIFNRERVLFRPIVIESLELIRESAKKKGITVIPNISEQLEVFADSNLLQTVIRNLVSNAVKFSARGGTVNISAKTLEDDSVEISVKDMGIGMNREMIETLFRIDVKNGRPGTEGEQSTGLGLLLCKEYIEKHGGHIRVESEVGKGSVFTFNIPPVFVQLEKVEL
ncbi:MAG: hybrid sensor histidine kinase/response regulator [Bacteroidetes bacterium]|nr:MAG: hybrid sensor histidine kinase/response regulator [Bacteroidota bacterium]